MDIGGGWYSARTHTHTKTNAYVCIYVYLCVCVCYNSAGKLHGVPDISPYLRMPFGKQILSGAHRALCEK